MGTWDADNRLYISAGRIKDLIIRAGENVAPLAIENTLMNHPALMEAAVVGIPDDRLGEKVKACVVFREGATADEQDVEKILPGDGFRLSWFQTLSKSTIRSQKTPRAKY